jgi:RNA polymerase sigma-70 factor (ECF subfamily)
MLRIALPRSDGDAAAMPSEDERLVAVVREHHSFVWRSLRRLGLPEHVADDCAQQVFVVYARRIADVTPGKDKSFLFGIALRVAQSTRRALGREAVATEDDVLDSMAASDAPADEALDDQRARGARRAPRSDAARPA